MAALSTCHAFGQGLVNFAPTSTLLPLRPAPTTSASRAPGARLHASRTVGGCVSATSRAAYGPAAVRRLGTQRAKATRVAATSDRPRRVALLGAGGGIGQPLALLLKLHPLVSHLALFDVVSVEGVHADLSHINTLAETSAHTGKENLKDALKGAEVVVIPAGLPRKPGMTRDDLFSINAGIVRDLVEACAEAAPGAMLCVITNPVNSTVPVAAQVLKQARVFDPRRLFGVTLLDVVRAETFYARELGLPPGQVSVPVVGGHAGTTILPLFSQAVPPPHSPLSADRLEELTRHTQDAGTEVVEAKQGKGSATLSMAYAAERFCDALLRAMAGEPGVEICAYVASDAREGLEFFASKVLLGKDGVEKILPLGQLSEAEERQLREAESVLKSNIHAGLAAEVI